MFDAVDVQPVPLTRADFLKMYGQCGGNLHRGHLRRIVTSKPLQPIDFGEINGYTTQITNLLRQHRLATANFKRHYFCVMENGPPGSKPAIITADGWSPTPPASRDGGASAASVDVLGGWGFGPNTKRVALPVPMAAIMLSPC
jgi:hypothetical protein